MYPSSLQQLIETFKYFPGIGEKTAERMAFSLMDMDQEKIEMFSKNVLSVKESIHRCPVCNGITDKEICDICNDKNRDKNVLFIVEDPKSVFLFERLGIFKGKYHVLNGLISPRDGVNPEDIDLEKLIDRVKNEKFTELILAFKPSIEGETTSLYIKRIFEDMNLSISKIASGIPMGADMEYIDAMTLERAFVDRKIID